jgi:hypothetical protein
VSIIYDRTDNSRGERVETVDVFCRGTFGMILTLEKGKVVSFTRIGGRTVENPSLSITEKQDLGSFMYNVRNYFDDAWA